MSKPDLRIFGNALGWAISAALVVAALGLLLAIQSVGEPTPPTEFSARPEFAQPLSLPIAPQVLLGPTAPQDAAILYRQAVEVFRRHPDAYLIFVKAGRAGDVGQVEPALEVLRRAAALRTPRLFADDPGQIVGYHPDVMLEQLLLLGNSAVRAGLLAGGAGDWRGAVGDFRAALALGTALYEERLTFAELAAGLELIGRSAPSLTTALARGGDAAGAKAARQFDDGRIDYVNEHVWPVENVIGAIDQDPIARNAGDIAYLAQKPMPERMWRVEAILKLGRYRFDAGRAADQRAAPRILAKIAEQDQDPVIRAAAKAAMSLTLENYRTID